MKKGILIAALALAATAAMAGCGDEFEPFRDGYEETIAGTKIVQEIEVKDGEIVVYGSEKTYVKAESGFTVTEKEKRLNDLSAESAYRETEKTWTAGKAATFNGSLKLDDDYFDAYEVSKEGLTAEVKDDAVDTVFGLTGEHADIKNAELTLSLSAERLAGLNVAFSSGKYAVTIRISFSY